MSLYKTLTELYGTSRNIRNAFSNAITNIRAMVVAELGRELTADENERFLAFTRPLQADGESRAIDLVARAQSGCFTEA